MSPPRRMTPTKLARSCWASQTDESIQVCTVDVHLAPVFVDDRADLGDRLLEDPVRGGIGDHRGSKPWARVGRLAGEVIDVDVAHLVAPHDHHVHAGHHGTRRIGSVGTLGDQAHRAVHVAAGPVVAADGKEPGELALAACIRLQTHSVVAGEIGRAHV